jgi:hypothetical protein
MSKPAMNTKDGMPKWLDFLMRSGTVEFGFQRAETWNEGVDGRRYKQAPMSILNLTLRAPKGWTISGDQEAVEWAYQALLFLGFLPEHHITTHFRDGKGKKRFYLYIDLTEHSEIAKSEGAK